MILRACLRSAVFCAALPLLAAAAQTPAAKNFVSTAQVQQAALENEVLQIVSQHHGSIALYARQLNTGKEFAMDADKP
ncbi:MAG: hypothetical protein ACRYF4_07380, partial [Janthinobacterium lividum]